MSADSTGDAGSLLLGLIDTVSDLRKRLDRHDTRLEDHEARLEELDEQMGLGDGMTDAAITRGLSSGLRFANERESKQERTCDASCPHVHVHADISLDDGFETVLEEVEK